MLATRGGHAPRGRLHAPGAHHPSGQPHGWPLSTWHHPAHARHPAAAVHAGLHRRGPGHGLHLWRPASRRHRPDGHQRRTGRPHPSPDGPSGHRHRLASGCCRLAGRCHRCTGRTLGSHLPAASGGPVPGHDPGARPRHPQRPDGPVGHPRQHGHRPAGLRQHPAGGHLHRPAAGPVTQPRGTAAAARCTGCSALEGRALGRAGGLQLRPAVLDAAARTGLARLRGHGCPRAELAVQGRVWPVARRGSRPGGRSGRSGAGARCPPAGPALCRHRLCRRGLDDSGQLRLPDGQRSSAAAAARCGRPAHPGGHPVAWRHRRADRTGTVPGPDHSQAHA